MSNEITLGNIFSTAINFLQNQQIIPGNPTERRDNPEDSFELCSCAVTPPEAPSSPISISASQRRQIESAILELLANRTNLPANFCTALESMREAFRQRIRQPRITISNTDLVSYILTIQRGITDLPNNESRRTTLPSANRLLTGLQNIHNQFQQAQTFIESFTEGFSGIGQALYRRVTNTIEDLINTAGLPPGVRSRNDTLGNSLLLFNNANGMSDLTMRLPDGRFFILHTGFREQGYILDPATGNIAENITINNTPAHEAYRNARVAIELWRSVSWGGDSSGMLPSEIPGATRLRCRHLGFGQGYALTYHHPGDNSHGDVIRMTQDGNLFLLHPTNRNCGYIVTYNSTTNNLTFGPLFDINATSAEHAQYRNARAAIETLRTRIGWTPPS